MNIREFGVTLFEENARALESQVFVTLLHNHEADPREAANKALREMLERSEQDPVLKAKMDRVKELKEELANI